MKSKTAQVDGEGQARQRGGGRYSTGTTTDVEADSANLTRTNAQSEQVGLMEAVAPQPL